MGCCASVVKVVPGDGSEYEEQDVYINPSEYDEDAASCRVQFGEITYSKADSDGIATKEAGGMLGVRKTLIVAQAFVLHGINGDPNQYTSEALKESPKLNRKETTRVLQWIDDILQCALYQHIANNPKKSHVTLRGIASSAKFKNRTLIQAEHAESCGITESSQASAPDIALNAAVSSPPQPRPQHLTIPVFEETKSASSNNSKMRMRPTRRVSVSSDSNFSNRTAKSGFQESPLSSPDEKNRQKAFDARLSFAPNLSKLINMDGALLALNQHCQAVQLARDSGGQNLLGSTLGSTSRLDDTTRGYASFRSVSEFSGTKLVDVRELCLRHSVTHEDREGGKRGNAGGQVMNVDCTVGQLNLSSFSEDVSKQLHMISDRSESMLSPSISDRRDSVRTNDKGENGNGDKSSAFPTTDARTGRGRKLGSAPHVLEVPMAHQPSPQPIIDNGPLGHRFSSPSDSALSWKERTLTFDALKTFIKYQAFLLKQRKNEEIEFDRRVHTQPPTLRTLVFGPYPYSAHQIRPGLIPSSGPITNASRLAMQRNMAVPARKGLQPAPPQSSDSEKDD